MRALAVFMYGWGVVCMVAALFGAWPDKATAYAFASCMFAACAAVGAWR